MRRIGIVLVVGFTVLAGVALPVGGVQAAVSTAGVDAETTWGQTTPPDDPENETTEAAPGTRLAGSVGVQGAELGSELETRSLDHQLNRSNSNASKAQVIARQATQSQARLAALRTERQQLETARENGSIGANEYRVRAAHLSARAVALERVSNRTTQTASGLPRETLRQNGVNVTSLETLRSSADQLTGPDIAAIARTLAGPGATRGTGLERAENATKGGAGPGRAADSPGRSGGPPEGRERAHGGDPAASDETASGNETATASNGRSGESSAGESSRGTGNDRSGGSNGNGRSAHADGTDRSGNGSKNTSDPGRPGSRVDED